MTYERTRSITGPYLAVLGASATVVGIVGGLGEQNDINTGNQRCSYEDGSVIMQLPMQIGGRWTCMYDHAPQTKHSKSIEL